MENEVGICALIRERSSHILEANENSRITILTHNTSVMQELSYVFDDINSTKTKDKNIKLIILNCIMGKWMEAAIQVKEKNTRFFLNELIVMQSLLKRILMNHF